MPFVKEDTGLAHDYTQDSLLIKKLISDHPMRLLQVSEFVRPPYRPPLSLSGLARVPIFIHISFDQHLLSAYYVVDTRFCFGELEVTFASVMLLTIEDELNHLTNHL